MERGTGNHLVFVGRLALIPQTYSNQTWGFAIVDGERRYVRRTTFTASKQDGPIYARFVYDYSKYSTSVILMYSELFVVGTP